MSTTLTSPCDSGMKSRRQILEELDIKSRLVLWSQFTRRPRKALTEMVKARIFIVAAVSIIITTCYGLDGQLKKYVFNNNGLGTYSFEYETQDGTFRREDGGLVKGRDGSLVVRGEYGYIDPSGRPFALRYIADANGFQPLLDEDTRFNDRRIY